MVFYNILKFFVEGYYLFFLFVSEMKEKFEDRVCVFLFFLDEIRVVKDDEEIEKIKKVVEIVDRVFEYILKFIKLGILENEIVVEFNYFILKNGVKGFLFEFIVVFGKRSFLLYGVVIDKKIEFGDIVIIDFGCNFDGYMFDMIRMVFVGKVEN